MKYFDAQKRAKSYVTNKNIKKLKKVIHSKDYLDVPVQDRLKFFIEWLGEQVYDDFAAVDLEITVEDEGENILTDEEIFEIMSNSATASA